MDECQLFRSALFLFVSIVVYENVVGGSPERTWGEANGVFCICIPLEYSVLPAATWVKLTLCFHYAGRPKELSAVEEQWTG